MDGDRALRVGMQCETFRQTALPSSARSSVRLPRSLVLSLKTTLEALWRASARLLDRRLKRTGIQDRVNRVVLRTIEGRWDVELQIDGDNSAQNRRDISRRFV